MQKTQRSLSFATPDLDREARQGFPEVIFGLGKTKEQILAIAQSILAHSGRILITRITEEHFLFLQPHLPQLEFNPIARCIYFAGLKSSKKNRPLSKHESRETHESGGKKTRTKPSPHILIVSAGTSDLSVVEEAALTARLMGCEVKTINDIGIAGIDRLLKRRPDLLRASVIIAVAGMEGALPSVIAGLVDKPVIGVPTSIGYGSSNGGMAALMAMLNSCASGLTVVNIDNGFGAGFAAAQMLRLAS